MALNPLSVKIYDNLPGYIYVSQPHLTRDLFTYNMTILTE